MFAAAPNSASAETCHSARPAERAGAGSLDSARDESGAGAAACRGQRATSPWRGTADAATDAPTGPASKDCWKSSRARNCYTLVQYTLLSQNRERRVLGCFYALEAQRFCEH